jgi:hypothetical protein
MVPEEAKNPSRRKFLAIASVAAVSGAGAGVLWYRSHSDPSAASAIRPFAGTSRNPVTPAGAATEQVPDGGVAVANREHEAFLQNVPSEFQVATDGEPSVSIRLKEVTKVRRQIVKGVPHDSFALLFDGPAEHPLSEVIHRFHHERLGDLEFFLSSYGKPGKTISYQAVIDRAV